MNKNIQILVLGTVQDGGYPHTGCNNICCKRIWGNYLLRRNVASIALIDHKVQKYWIIDITPDFKIQYQMINEYLNKEYCFSGIFLTHSHIGHYSGIFELGLEVLNSNNIPVYAMPKLMKFLKSNPSIDFLFKSKNIKSIKINNKEKIILSDDVSINSFLVPHRNEMSETVGYKIKTMDQSVIYIPDIDSWHEWNENIINVIENNNLIFIDGTFYSKDELKHRNIDNVPHPSILDSLELFENIGREKNKIYFTHLNHTNKVLDKDSTEYKNLIRSDFNILEDGQVFNI